MFKKIGWELTFTYVLIIVFSMAILGYFLLNFVEGYFTGYFRQELYRQAQLIAEGWPSSFSLREPSHRQIRFYWETIDRISHQTGVRVRILTDRGAPVYDTGGTREPDLAIRNEVKEALSGKPGSGISAVDFTQAYPIFDRVTPGQERSVVGLVYLSRSRTYLGQILSHVRGQFYFGILVTLALSLILSLIFSHYITAPIVDITSQADDLARGRLDRRVTVNTRNEIGQLSLRFNMMADALGQTLNQLTDEKNKLSAILKEMAGGVLVIDTDLQVVMVNRRAYNLLGIREVEILGRKLEQVMPGHSLLRLVEDADFGREIHGPLEDLPEEKAVNAHLTPLFSEEGQPHGAVIILNDVTHFKRLDRMRTEFVSNVSHELRTPLASIKGLAELLMDGAIHEEKADQFLSSINREVDRLTRLVKDLLDLSKMESGMLKLELHPVRMADIISQVILRLTPQAEKKKITIETAFECASPAMADMDRIQQVIINLVDNALRYTPRGERIIVTTGLQDGFCLVQVKDTGPGISKENMERVFERFFRADRARSRGGGGFGLGLAITRQIVENHGGTIGVRSTPPCGTTFFFTLPLARPVSRDTSNNEDLTDPVE